MAQTTDRQRARRLAVMARSTFMITALVQIAATTAAALLIGLQALLAYAWPNADPSDAPDVLFIIMPFVSSAIGIIVLRYGLRATRSDAAPVSVQHERGMHGWMTLLILLLLALPVVWLTGGSNLQLASAPEDSFAMSAIPVAIIATAFAAAAIVLLWRRGRTLEQSLDEVSGSNDRRIDNGASDRLLAFSTLPLAVLAAVLLHAAAIAINLAAIAAIVPAVAADSGSIWGHITLGEAILTGIGSTLAANSLAFILLPLALMASDAYRHRRRRPANAELPGGD